jgi:hypothetical protein
MKIMRRKRKRMISWQDRGRECEDARNGRGETKGIGNCGVEGRREITIFIFLIILIFFISI